MIRTTNKPPLSPRRQRRRDARTEDILAAAQGLLVEEGFEALTMQRLANELDHAVAAVYRYFPSKDALLAELQRRVLVAIRDLNEGRREALEALLVRRSAGRKAAGIVRVVALLDAYRDFARDETERFQLFALTVGDPRERIGGDEARATYESALVLLSDLRDRLVGAADEGALDRGDAMDRAVLLWSSVHGLLLVRKLSRFDPRLFDVERLADRLVEDLLRGYGAAPAVLKEALTLTAAARRLART